MPEQPATGRIRDWWRERQISARRAMESAPPTGRTLIEVAAQHPLVEGTLPGTEFTIRLNVGIALAESLVAQGWEVSIYVPGSRHREGAHVDALSLSTAGTTYLNGRLPEGVAVYGDDANARYLPEAGVYGSADECFVTARLFRDGHYQSLHAVVSPQQLPRKMLHYLAFGVEPLMHTAPVSNPYHNMLDELFEAIPAVLALDPTAHGPDSEISRTLRSQRRPG